MDRYAKLNFAIRDLKNLGFKDIADKLSKHLTAAMVYQKIGSLPPFKKQLALSFEKEMNAKADSLGLAYKSSWTELTGDKLKEWLDNASVPLRRALWDGLDLGMRPNSDGSVQLGFKATSATEQGWMPLKGLVEKTQEDAKQEATRWSQEAERKFKQTLDELKNQIANDLKTKAPSKVQEKPTQV